jgi:hypothetical protein
MNIPCLSDTITFDANACIRYALRYGEQKALYVEQFDTFKKNCEKIGIIIGYFNFVKDQSYRNFTSAVNRFARSKKINSYTLMKFNYRCKDNLDNLFDNLTEFQEICTEAEIGIARDFFIQNQKDVSMYVQHLKSNIPEYSDIKLLVCCDNQNCNITYLVSDDSHFTAYAPEIEISPYTVSILPLRDLMQKMIQWKWI